MNRNFVTSLQFTAAWMAVCIAVPVHAQNASLSLSKIENRVIVKIGDQTFAEYVLDDPETNKPYLWPVYGPTGKAMTRSYPMRDVEGEVKDHYHHRGIWFGHQDIAGSDTWAEKKTFDKGEKNKPSDLERIATLGQQKHRKIRTMSTAANQATIESDLDYLNADGKKYLSESRTMIFSVDGTTRVIDFNQEFMASEGEVTFGDMKDAGLCIRVPTTMSVDSKKGGYIVNSEGNKDKDAWGKRAKWCDYVGPVDDQTLGIAIFNHPSSFRPPTTWHVRTYGLFTANPFGTLDPNVSPNGPHTLKAGEKLTMKHRFVLHDGDFDLAMINAAYDRYIKAK